MERFIVTLDHCGRIKLPLKLLREYRLLTGDQLELDETGYPEVFVLSIHHGPAIGWAEDMEEMLRESESEVRLGHWDGC